MGQVIEFYHPEPKQPKPVVEEVDSDQVLAGDVLKSLCENAQTLSDVLVIFRDRKGNLGIRGNLNDMAEALLLMEQTKLRMLKSTEDTPPPRGIA